ncbi:MAG: hypothetical protein ACRCSK_06335, partial [Fusobacteriaceae bacterium]
MLKRKLLSFTMVGTLLFTLISCGSGGDPSGRTSGGGGTDNNTPINPPIQDLGLTLDVNDNNYIDADSDIYKTNSTYGTIQNFAILYVSGNSASAMEAARNGSTVINNKYGEININTSYKNFYAGLRATGANSSAINYGKINLKLYGSTNTGGSGIEVTGANSFGINTDSGIITLEDSETNYGRYGMNAASSFFGNSLLLNYGTITDSENSNGGVTAMNMSGDSIFTTSTGINYGNITLYSSSNTIANSYGMHINIGNAINAAEGVINIIDSGSKFLIYGMKTGSAQFSSSSSIVNYGIIKNSENSSGSVVGMNADGGNTAFNHGKISLYVATGTLYATSGMSSTSGGSSINSASGIIEMSSDNFQFERAGSAMKVSVGSAENLGTIYVSGTRVFGMSISMPGSQRSNNIIKNMESGVIYVVGKGTDKEYDFSAGMYSIGYYSEVHNLGRIEVYGSKGYGIYVNSEQTKVFLGANSSIVLKAGSTNSVGLYLRGLNSTVTVIGDSSLADRIKDESSNGSGNSISDVPTTYGAGGTNVTLNGTDLIADGNGNRAFVIETGATIVSQKEMIVDKNFDIADFGGGRFVMGSYAKLSASNVSGDIYLAPDMVPLYANFGTIKNAITQNSSSNESNWFKANLKSYSEFFVAKDVTYDETGKAVNLNLERKSFDTVLSDKNLAKYLEDNYTNTNSSNKDKFYDGILRATDLTAAQTEDKIKNMFG